MMGIGHIIVDTINGAKIFRLQEYSTQNHIFCHIMICTDGLYHNIRCPIMENIDGIDQYD